MAVTEQLSIRNTCTNITNPMPVFVHICNDIFICFLNANQLTPSLWPFWACSFLLHQHFKSSASERTCRLDMKRKRFSTPFQKQACQPLPHWTPSVAARLATMPNHFTEKLSVPGYSVRMPREVTPQTRSCQLRGHTEQRSHQSANMQLLRSRLKTCPLCICPAVHAGTTWGTHYLSTDFTQNKRSCSTHLRYPHKTVAVKVM